MKNFISDFWPPDIPNDSDVRETIQEVDVLRRGASSETKAAALEMVEELRGHVWEVMQSLDSKAQRTFDFSAAAAGGIVALLGFDVTFNSRLAIACLAIAAACLVLAMISSLSSTTPVSCIGAPKVKNFLDWTKQPEADFRFLLARNRLVTLVALRKVTLWKSRLVHRAMISLTVAVAFLLVAALTWYLAQSPRCEPIRQDSADSPSANPCRLNSVDQPVDQEGLHQTSILLQTNLAPIYAAIKELP